MPAFYRVQLSPDDRATLTALTRRGRASARVISRARILLLANRRLRDSEIASATGVSARTAQRVRRRWCEGGLAVALYDRPRPGAIPSLDGPAKAYLIALACSDPPDGAARWTMQVLADRLVELAVAPQISDETVRRTLKKRPQALAASGVVHPNGQRHVRGTYGGGA